MKFKINFFLLTLLLITLDSCSTTILQVNLQKRENQEEENIIDDVIEEKKDENDEKNPEEEPAYENDDSEEIVIIVEESDEDIKENEENTYIPVMSEENFTIDDTNNTYTGDIQNITEVTINVISPDLINANFQNNGFITVNGDFSMGINAVNSNVVNNRDIIINGPYSAGISSIIPDEASVIINNGNIFVNGYYARGIFSFNNSEIINDINGILYVSGEKAGGMTVKHDTLENAAVNKGKIIVSGKDAVGMSTIGGLIINEGIIEVTGENAVGMYIDGNNAITAAINNGEILVGRNANSAITAIGSNARIENNGIIRLDQNHSELKNNSAENIVIKALNGAEIINTGTISTENILELSSDKNSILRIGTNKNKEYGTFNASEIKINGNIIIDTAIVTSGYEEEYILQDILKASSVEISDETSFETDSILYKVNLKKTETDSFNAVLNRTNHTFSTVTNEKYKTTADIFTNAMNIEKYSKLSTEAQNIINTVYLKTKTPELINQSMKEITPTLYSYIENHIINTESAFQNALNGITSNIGIGKIGFALIGELKTDNINSREDSQLPEYDSKLSGVAGSIKITNNTYINTGYGKSSYKDDRKNHVISDSFFLGYSFSDINKTSNKNIGFLANYNINNGKRAIDVINMEENTNFNSYSFSLYGDISKKYGETFSIEPYLKFTALYGYYENINESGKAGSADIESESFLSAVPTGGVKASINKSDFSIYILGEIGYELMNVSQDKKAVLNGFNGTMIIPAYNNNKVRFNTGTGIDYQINKFNISLDALIDLSDANALTGRINLGYSF